MLISVVTPSYNQARFLDQTIRSVLGQDHPNTEYIVVDGASTDGSADIIRKHEGRLAWWCSEVDNGQADAINKGFARSRGDILGWLNSDDLYNPGALSAVAEYFAGHPDVDMIYGDVDVIDEHGTQLYRLACREYDFKDLLSSRLVIPQPAAFFRRRCFEAVGGLDASLFHALDYDLWVKIGLRFDMRRIEPVLAQFRVHSNAKSVAQAFVVGPELLKTLDWAFTLPDLPADVRLARDEIYSGALVVAGTAYYSTGRLSEARASYVRAIGLFPPQLWRSNAATLLLRTFLGQRMLEWLRGRRQSLRAWQQRWSR